MNKTTSLLLMSSAMSFCCVVSIDTAKAQIIPDRTLPVNSLTNTQGNTVEITGGTQAGGNLFHSFEQFSVPTGTAAFFNNAPNIENILTRVTGGQISSIDGLIKANGIANLFLLNPNGIVFGPNARLDIGGSFLASTATGLTFADGSQFMAVNPEGQPLLTVSVPLGLQMPGVPKSIINQSRATDLRGRNAGLQVQPGRSLTLVGGNLDLAGGNLTAIQGQIELGSVVNGQVTLNPAASGLALGYEGVEGFGNIQLSGGASVNASGPGGGSVRVVGGTVALTEGSNIVADTLGNVDGRGIEIQANQLSIDGGAFVSSSTIGGGNAGNLTVRAAESVELTGNASIGDLLEIFIEQAVTFSELPPGTIPPFDLANGLFSLSFGSGASGNLAIETDRFVARQGAIASTSSFGQGLGGDLNITTPPTGLVELTDAGLITGTAGPQPAGNLTINTGRLLARQGGLAATTTISGSGEGGKLTVNADSVELMGTTAREFTLFRQFAFPENSEVFSQPAPISSGLLTLSFPGAGAAGDLDINANRLQVGDGAIVSTTTVEGASSGNITIRASEFVELTGRGKLQIVEEIFDNNTDPGDLRSGIFSSSLLAGEAGNVTIETERLTVRDGAVVSASTFGDGPGGNLVINAPNGSVELIGGALLTGTAGVRDAGNLTVSTGQLRLEAGGLIATSSVAPQEERTEPRGRGGNVLVNAESVELTGISGNTFNLPDIFVEPRLTPSGVKFFSLGAQPIPSSILTLTFGRGDAGNLRIETGELTISNGATISTSTAGLGRSGDLTVVASESITLVGQEPLTTTINEVFKLEYDFSDVRNGLYTSSFGRGQAGNLTIETPRFVANNAFVSATNFFLDTSQRSDTSGNLTLRGPDGGKIDIDMRNSGIITGTLGSLRAGNIEVKAGNLTLREGSIFATSTFSRPSVIGGQGGNLTVNANSIELSGRSANLDIPSSLLTLTFGSGRAGNLTINTESFVARDGGLAAASTILAGSGGSVALNARSVELSGGTLPQRESVGRFPSGLRADAPSELPSFVPPGLRELIKEQVGTGVPGNLTVRADTLVVRDGAEVVVNAAGTAGNINITANNIRLSNGFIRGTTNSGDGGNVTLEAPEFLLVENGGRIAANAVGEGNGGNINIATEGFFVERVDRDIDASSPFGGVSGNVDINQPDVATAQELIEVPEQVINPEEQISLSCIGDREEQSSEITITGRGGLPPRPSDPLSSQALVDFDTTAERQESDRLISQNSDRDSNELPPPATGWYVDAEGNVVLTSRSSNPIPQNSPLTSPNCRHVQSTR